MEHNLPFGTYKGKRIVQTDYMVDTYQYKCLLEDGTYVLINKEYVEGTSNVAETVEIDPIVELKKDFAETIKKLNKGYEEKLNEYKRLRAEDASSIKHLQDEVLKLRRELQRRDESNSGYISPTSHPGKTWVTYDESASTPVPNLPTYTSNSTLPTSGSDTSNDWSTTINNTLQLLRKRDNS